MIVEIRTYRLRHRTRDDFVRVMRTEALPLLASFGIEVLDAGPSLADEDGQETAYLIRAFGSLAEREEQETRFYGSDAWRNGPRERVLAPIESYHTVVLDLPAEAVQGLRGRAPDQAGP